MEQNTIWRQISKDTKVNDEQLGPWENAGVDDSIINEYLKKRFLKEINMMIIFEVLLSVTCFVGLIESLMLWDDIFLTILLAVIAIYSNGCLYKNIQNKRILRVIIQNKEYQLCDCEAFDIDITKTGKYCYIKDTNGQTFLIQKNDNTPVPIKITYHGYFSDKEFDARLLRMKGIDDKMFYVVFPEYYLKNYGK